MTANDLSTWIETRTVYRADVLGGARVIVNSRLSVERLGSTPERLTRDVLIDYPYVTDEDLAFAREYVREYGRLRAAEATA